MACLRTGADLVTVCTAHEAALPLKCYSPELMVQAVYRAADFDRLARNDPTVTPDQAAVWMRDMVDAVMECCERAHCLILGPGLGRCPAVMKAVAEIIWRARGQNIYMVLDADALFLLAQPEFRNLLQGYDKAVLTPNLMEYQRLHQLATSDDDDLESVVIVQKGHEDHIRVNDTTLLTCAEVGGLKRSGGIGDVLAGVLGTMVSWHKILVEGRSETVATTIDLPLTCWTACCLVKLATRRAFLSKRRAMSATDVLNELGTSLDEMESVWV
jgi:ATP-dependent NAD(P)H-hydrate dehydratase